MKTIQKTLCALSLATCFSSGAGAATLMLEPAATTVATGDSFTLDLVVSGLGAGVGPSLGNFEVDIAFDPGALSFDGYAFGPLLGDVAAFEALDVGFGEFTPGVVNIALVSLLTAGELIAIQPDTFVLATLAFTASGLAPGSSTAIDIAAVFALGDSGGSPVPVDGVSGALISAVPLPAAIWLFMTALLGLAGMSSVRAGKSPGWCNPGSRV